MLNVVVFPVAVPQAVTCQICLSPTAFEWTDQGALSALDHLVTDHGIRYVTAVAVLEEVITNHGGPWPWLRPTNDTATPDTPPERRHP